jgi:tellurite resistance protein TerC
METNFTIQNGVRMATPLLIVVAVIEFTDVLFAVDSIPAILQYPKTLSFFIPLIFCYFGFYIFFTSQLYSHVQQIPYGLATPVLLCQNAYITLVSYFFRSH